MSALPLLAVAAGVLSFTSPCTLPLVPGYISYISGVAAGRGRAVAASLLFVLGFTVIFTALGAAASELGTLLEAQRLLLEKFAGIAVVGLGLFLIGAVQVPLLMSENRPLLNRVPAGPPGAFLLGLAFALGWTPCIGPVLASILTLASAQATLVSGAGLLLLYSLGLGIPFVLAAALVERFAVISTWLRRRFQLVEMVSGLLLVAMGLLIFSGQLQSFMSPLTEIYSRLHWPPI